MADEKKDIVVITGGSGFLAQHLIRELQLKWANRTKEIRVIDKKIFKKFLGNKFVQVYVFFEEIFHLGDGLELFVKQCQCWKLVNTCCNITYIRNVVSVTINV